MHIINIKNQIDMSNYAIILTVKSINNKNLAAAVDGLFVVENMDMIQANLNAQTAITVTPASATGTSEWGLYFSKGMAVPSVLYFTVVDNGSTGTVSVYSDSTLTHLVAQGTATHTAVNTLVEKNESGITGKVKTTDSTVGSSSVTIAGFTASKSLNLLGDSQFMYVTDEGVKTKYTVDETVAEIEALINPAS